MELALPGAALQGRRDGGRVRLRFELGSQSDCERAGPLAIVGIGLKPV